MKLGPNVKKLMCHKMSMDAIPVTTPQGGGLAAGVAFLSDPKRISSSAKESMKWIEAALQAVRTAVEPNPWKNADDEAIAGEVLRQIEERKRQQTKKV